MYDFKPLRELVILINLTPFVLVGLLIFINILGRKKKETKNEILARRVTSIILIILLVINVAYVGIGWFDYLK